MKSLLIRLMPAALLCLARTSISACSSYLYKTSSARSLWLQSRNVFQDFIQGCF